MRAVAGTGASRGVGVLSGPCRPGRGPGAAGPGENAEQRESISIAVMLPLERLSPAERAVFVLPEAFACSHRDIAGVLALSEANSRQLHRRARKRVGEARSRFDPDHQQRSRLVERFLAAAREGDVRGPELILAADVTSWADDCSGCRTRVPQRRHNPQRCVVRGLFATRGAGRPAGTRTNHRLRHEEQQP